MNKSWGRWKEAEDIDIKPRVSSSRDSFWSRSEGDEPLFTDAMFNFVPGSAFEIGSSLAILDNPGIAGKLVDNIAKSLSNIITLIYETPIGDLQVAPYPYKWNNLETLKEYFNRKLFNELQPDSDQVGRCCDLNLLPDWINGTHQGKRWLKEELDLNSDSEEYTFINMLTKVRAINALGGMLRDLMRPCPPQASLEVISAAKHAQKITSMILNKPIQVIEERLSQIQTNILHQTFHEEKTRGRTEKTPIVFGQTLTNYLNLTISTVDMSKIGLGCGKIFHPSGMKGNPEVIAEYERLVKVGRQTMPRLGQDIKDTSAPGLMGDSAQALIPPAFLAIGLHDAIESHRYLHGSGLNRWQLTGTYAIQSWDNNLPAAGAQSGGTTSFFISANCLSDLSVFGNPDTLQMGLIIAAFMNFGGHHSFVETFPIAQAISRNTKFLTQVTAVHRHLYSAIEKAVAINDSPDAIHRIHEYSLAYAETILNIQSEAVKKQREIDHAYCGV